MTLGDFLSQLGLSKKQIRIYLDLAANPESTVVDIYRRIHQPRSSIYLELERLINKSYVISKKIGNSTFFKITEPKILKFSLEEEIEKLQANQKKFKAQLYQVRNNKEYDALTKEIDNSEELINKLKV